MIKISVIMSVYNAEEYLNESIRSILGQSFQDFEYIIIDDCSTDGSLNIIKSYKHDSRIKLLENEVNIGLTKSLNKALNLAGAPYIARMDADDIALPYRFEKQFAFMEKHPRVGIVGSSYYEIDEDGKREGEIILPVEDSEIRRAIFKFNPFNHGTVMIRKGALDYLGFYNEKLVNAQDYELWFRILSKHKGYNTPDKLVLRRNPKNSITVKRKRRQLGYTLMAWRIGKNYIRPSIIDYIYYARFMFQYSIPSVLIPSLRKMFSRERYRKSKKYYVIQLRP